MTRVVSSAALILLWKLKHAFGMQVDDARRAFGTDEDVLLVPLPADASVSVLAQTAPIVCF